MKTMRKCPTCKKTTLKQTSEGFGGTTWYIDFECTTCNYFKTEPCRSCQPDPLWETQYSWSSTPSTPIGIEL